MTNSVTPYLLTIDRLSKIPPASVIQSQKISGAIVEVSDYFDFITHARQKDAVNPNLVQQLKTLNQLNLPYGFYLTLRSRTVAEVDAELAYFFSIISGMYPKVGIWVRCHFYHVLKADNNVLINRCFEIFKARGFANQIGLYLNESNFNKITWENYAANWLLWLDKPITTSTELQYLLVDGITPEGFFKV